MRPGTKTGRALLRRRTYGGALALLLVLALLVCHGLLGAMHQAMPGTEVGEAKPMAGPAQAGMEHGSSTPAAQPSSSDLLGHAVALLFPAPLMEHAGGGAATGEGSGLTNHVGSLIFVILGLLWTLLKGAPGWRRGPLDGATFREPRLAAALRFPPVPALSALQVFRL